MVITRAAAIDRLEGIFDSKVSGSYLIIFQDETFVKILSEDTDKALDALVTFFGASKGKGDLQEKIHGQRLIYCMNERQELRGFSRAEEWEGPEMDDGDFLIGSEDDCRPWYK